MRSYQGHEVRHDVFSLPPHFSDGASLSTVSMMPPTGARCELPRTPLLKLSEKPRRRLQRCPGGRQRGVVGSISASVYQPYSRSERSSYPFSDSFSRHLGEYGHKEGSRLLIAPALSRFTL